ncbi:hypothetical protein ACGFIG_09400 [Micromonospora sp. NPDC049048]|uniref:hypothetical protein n=1 Tax=Micromonospora sp. NPDC049048 TaxID=3364263 RepID=UPI0037122E04
MTTTEPADRGPVVSPCDWCRKPGATHGPDEHPLPKTHLDYDAFFDASDDELAAMTVCALDHFGEDHRRDR